MKSRLSVKTYLIAFLSAATIDCSRVLLPESNLIYCLSMTDVLGDVSVRYASPIEEGRATDALMDVCLVNFVVVELFRFTGADNILASAIRLGNFLRCF